MRISFSQIQSEISPQIQTMNSVDRQREINYCFRLIHN